MQFHSHRRLAAAALCVGFAAALAACGSSKSNTKTSSGSNAAATTTGSAGKSITIAGVTFDNTDPYFISMKCGAQAEAKRLGVSLNWQPSSTPDVSSELTTLNSVAATSPNAVI